MKFIMVIYALIIVIIYITIIISLCEAAHAVQNSQWGAYHININFITV